MKSLIEAYIGKRIDGTKSRMPALLDKLQSITGLILGLFIIGHIFFTSSILFGKDRMYFETKLFEGSLFLDKPEPMLVSIMAGVIFLIFILHAGLAMRKFPYKYREYRVLKVHSLALDHTDTKLWLIQAVTGFLMFFLASVHLWLMMTIPEKIGPFASSDRVYSDNMWILYALLIILVLTHAMIGLYRLSVKWGVLVTKKPREGRVRNKKIMLIAIILLSLIGYSSLFTYWSIGKEHKDSYGQRYTPKSQTQKGGRE